MSQGIGPQPRRPRVMLRRVLLSLLVVVLLATGAVLFFLWFTSSALTELLAEMDRQDPGWRLEEMEARRKVIADAQNSALHILAIDKMQGGQGVITQANGRAFENLPPQVQLNEQQTTLLAKRLDILRKAVLEARKLKDMPEGKFPFKYSVDFYSTILDCQKARSVAELLLWDAAARGHHLDADGALESCQALHNSACASGDDLFLISLLVRYALNGVTVEALERTLAQSQFTDASEPGLKRMQTALAKEATEPSLLSALRGERAGAHRFLAALAEGKTTTNLLGPPRDVSMAVESALSDRFPGYLAYQHAALLRFYNKFVEAAKLPDEEADRRFEALEANIQGEPYLVRHLFPALNNIREADRRTRANLTCAAVALAAERFRIARNRWPQSLEELAKSGLLDAVPADPYDGKPIRLKRTADGLVIYSLGRDKIDNDGNVDRERPFEPGMDLGFRLWDVARRRQPPNPPVAEEEPVR